MNISHGTRFSRWHSNNGYGYATDRILDSLHYLGHEVKPNDPTAQVQIWFDQPQHWRWNQNQYKIGYHPWESTDMKKLWKKSMNKCDEIWTPSPLIADWYREIIDPPVYVYQHGVDADVWTPVHRKVNDKFRILHVGGEHKRKGQQIVLKAFRAAFGDNDDVELTLKVTTEGWNINKYGNVSIISNTLPINDLVKLFHDHHMFVYPTWGEGFGLLPLQAMATGMPTLTTGACAPYRHLLPIESQIESKLVPTPWPDIHPGKMLEPSLDDTIDKMRFSYDNFEVHADLSHYLVADVVTEYNWDRITNETFTELENRLKI